VTEEIMILVVAFLAGVIVTFGVSLVVALLLLWGAAKE
jgi:hypothetical protein